MKKFSFIFLILSLFSVIAYLAFRELRKTRRFVGKSFPASLSKQYYTVPSSHQHFLKCKYEFTQQMYGAKIVDIINERMKILQSDEVGYQSLLSLGNIRREMPFKTVYSEALRQLQLEGIIAKADEDLCSQTADEAHSDDNDVNTSDESNEIPPIEEEPGSGGMV